MHKAWTDNLFNRKRQNQKRDSVVWTNEIEIREKGEL